MSNMQNIVKLQFVVIIVLSFFIVWQILNQPSETVRVKSDLANIPNENIPVAASFDQVTSVAGEVVIPLSELNPYRAQFFRFRERIQFFLIRDPEDSVIAAFNACRTCYSQHKGYRQSGDSLVCNSCNDTTYFQQIGVNSKECSPVQLTARIEEGMVHIREEDLRDGALYFYY